MRRQPTLSLTADRDRAVQEAFTRLWAAYPDRRPNPRHAALATFALHVRRGIDPEHLVQAARAFAAEVKERGIKPEFVPHARTWLHQQRFRDYPPFTKAPASSAPVEDAGISHPWWPAFAGSVPPHEFRAFVAPLAVERVEGDSACLRAPSRFVADTARQRYAVLLCRALGVGTVEIVHGAAP